MRSEFKRGLSDKLMHDLLNGPAGAVLRVCQGLGLDVRLREDYLNVYFRGRSLARIVGRRGLSRLEVHHKYLVDDRIGTHQGRRTGAYCSFDVDAQLAAAYGAHVDALVDRAAVYSGPEEDVEMRLLEANNGSTPVWCFDRQIQVPSLPHRLDVMALRTDRPALVAIEVKRYPDPRIQTVPLQLHSYLEVFDPVGDGLREDVAASYRTVCKQLRLLGQPAPDPAAFVAGMPVEGLVIVSHYNRRSRLLPRAHQLAQTLSRPIHLWVCDQGESAIPAPQSWVRMG